MCDENLFFVGVFGPVAQYSDIKFVCYQTLALFSAVPEYVIKAQILAGGRGKGTFDTGFKGGVHLTRE